MLATQGGRTGELDLQLAGPWGKVWYCPWRWQAEECNPHCAVKPLLIDRLLSEACEHASLAQRGRPRLHCRQDGSAENEHSNGGKCPSRALLEPLRPR